MHARTGCDMNLHSVKFARKQHGRCGSHSLKHCKLGISKIITTYSNTTHSNGLVMW